MLLSFLLQNDHQELRTGVYAIYSNDSDQILTFSGTVVFQDFHGSQISLGFRLFHILKGTDVCIPTNDIYCIVYSQAGQRAGSVTFFFTFHEIYFDKREFPHFEASRYLDSCLL